LLERGVLALAERIVELETKKVELQGEIDRLHYVRRELARITDKEQQLREYFGLARFRSLKQVVGGGDMHSLAMAVQEADATGKKGPSGKDTRNAPETLPERLEIIAGNYDAFGELMVKQAEAWQDTPSILPVDAKRPVISSGFGWRRNPFTMKREFHAGIDIVGRTGTRVVAPAAGVVINRGHDRWLGNFLVLKHKEDIKTIYGHLDRSSVKKGDRVQRGDVIGFVGNTGLSTSSHLHYSVVEADRAVNPLQYVLDYPG
jgi:murein DD-endopeptidase MepM/ murein hydrolase activator NlpD